MMGEQGGAIRLDELAALWRTSKEALRMHIYRKHRLGTKNEIAIVRGRIVSEDFARLHRSYLERQKRNL